MATMDDVARRAGVSRSTVSYALSGSRPVSESTRREIRAAMTELGYTPNALARGLAAGSSRVLALLFPTPESGLGANDAEYVVAAAAQAREAGYHMVLWPYPSGEIDAVEQLIGTGLVDGVLVMEVRMDDPRLPLLERSNTPFVLVGRNGDPERYSYCDADFAAGGECAVRHLAELGHREIVVLNRDPATLADGVGADVRTRDGVLDACTRHRIAFHVVPAERQFAAGWAAFERMSIVAPGATAVVHNNDAAILGYIAAAAERGLRVPRDLSVIALNTGGAAAVRSRPELTSVSPDHRELARNATRVLVRRLAGGAAQTWARGARPPGQARLQLLSEPVLVDRGSTAPPRSGLRPVEPGCADRA